MEPCLFAKVSGATLDPFAGYFIRQATRQGCLFGDYEGNSSMRERQMLDGPENGRDNYLFEVAFKRTIMRSVGKRGPRRATETFAV